MASLQHLRIAARSLGRAPGTTLAMVLTLSVGILTASTAAIATRRALHPELPLAHADRVALVWRHTRAQGERRLPVAAPDAAEIARRSRLVEDVAFTDRVSDAVFSSSTGAERLRVARVTPNLFSLVGARALIGRTLQPGEGRLVANDSGRVVPPTGIVLSAALWRGRFGADSAILGRPLVLDRQPFVVVGIMPDEFTIPIAPGLGFVDAPEAWVPVRTELSALRRTQGFVDQDSDNSGAMLVRMRPGIDTRVVQREMDAIGAALRAEDPALRDAGLRLSVAPLRADVARDARPLLAALLANAALLLIVATVNVLGILLERVLARRGDFALRSALGASAAQIVAVVLAEVAIAAGFAVALAAAFVPALLRAAKGIRALEPALGAAAAHAVGPLGWTTAIAVLVTLVIGLAAGRVAAATPPGGTLGVRDVSSFGSAGRLHALLVRVQLAVAVALVAGALLVGRSAALLGAVNPGFAPEGALSFSLGLRGAPRLARPADRAALVHDAERRLLQLPGVTAAGAIGRLPFGERAWTNRFGLEGQPVEQWAANEADFRMITPGFFAAAGTRVVAGRAFTDDENRSEVHRVVIVDEALARRISPDGRVVGRRIGLPLDGRPVEAEIVGVVETMRFRSLAGTPGGAFFVPYRHEPSRDVAIVLRTTGKPMTLGAAVRAAIHEIAPDVAVYDVRPLADLVRAATADVRLARAALVAFSAVSALLALLGVYATLAYSVARRRRELGLRIALGATPGTIRRDILRIGIRLVIPGVVAGALVALASARALRGLVFGVSLLDVPILVAALGLVGAAALLAALAPARRAARIEPAEALAAP